MVSIKPQRVTKETKVIGKNLAGLRRMFGYSQAQIAEVLNVTFQQVQKYEKGESRISAEKLFLLQNFLGVPYSAFFKDMLKPAEIYPDQHDALLSVVKARVSELPDTQLNRKALGLVLTLVTEL